MLTGHCLVSEGSIVSHNNTAQFAPSKTNHRTKLLTTAALKGSLLILGKGYTGGGLASLLHQNEDWQVTPIVRLNFKGPQYESNLRLRYSSAGL